MILTSQFENKAFRHACPGKLSQGVRRRPELQQAHLSASSQLRRVKRVCPICRAVVDTTQQALSLPTRVTALKTWLISLQDFKQEQMKLDVSAGLYSSVEDFRVTDNIQTGEVSNFGPTKRLPIIEGG